MTISRERLERIFVTSPFKVNYKACSREPCYGWNPLRWLFGKPKRWRVVYRFEYQSWPNEEV